jgi:hypothetical protein
MKERVILIFLLIIILLFISIFLINRNITANTIKDYNEDLYIYTKAICNSSNFCQDQEITCIGNKTITKTPITGAVIQHSSDWIDSREKDVSKKLCE